VRDSEHKRLHKKIIWIYGDDVHNDLFTTVLNPYTSNHNSYSLVPTIYLSIYLEARGEFKP